MVFGESTRLPGEFFENTVDEYQDPPQNFVRNLAQFSATLSYKPPRHVDRKSFIEKALFAPQTTHVYVRIDSHRPPLRPVYKGPYKVLEKTKKHFLIDIHSGTDRVSIDRLKAAHLSLDTLNHDLPDSELSLSAAQISLGASQNHSTAPFLSQHISSSSHFAAETPPSITTTRHGRPVRKPAYLNDFV